MRELIETARDLAQPKHGELRPSGLRCAVSASYYALFHCLMRTCADSVIGKDEASRSAAAWAQVYRAPDHETCRRRCKQADRFGFPRRIVDFANIFVEMHEKRHLADYHPSPRLIQSEVVADVDSCEYAMERLRGARPLDKRAFVAFLLFERR